jgi:outer membrane protein assembly factor BamE (lipoprotein component of BamABCDE complex)
VTHGHPNRWFYVFEYVTVAVAEGCAGNNSQYAYDTEINLTNIASGNSQPLSFLCDSAFFAQM